VAGGASAPPATSAGCPVCASPHRRRIELRLFHGARPAQALAGLHGCAISPDGVSLHFESGHLIPDPALLVATLVELLNEAATGVRGTRQTTLATINQSQKLRLEVIKLIASLAHPSSYPPESPREAVPRRS